MIGFFKNTALRHIIGAVLTIRTNRFFLKDVSDRS